MSGPNTSVEFGRLEQAPSMSDRLLTAIAWTRALRARDSAFGAHLFADPTWDILLDLYINRGRFQPLCVSDLYLGSSAPPTTVLRRIHALEDRNFISREADRKDKRRHFVFLTDAGVEAMELALDRVIRSDKDLGRIVD